MSQGDWLPVVRRPSLPVWLLAHGSCLVVFVLIPATATGDLVHFDELNSWTDTGPTGSYYNGDSGIGSNSLGWSSGQVHFGNQFDESFGGIWNGFAYSNINDSTTSGITNQYAAFPGTDVGGTGNYAVGFSGDHAFFNLPRTGVPQSVFATNTTYAALSMLNGDQFGKKFGGPSGDDPDFFSVTFSGFDDFNGEGNLTGSVEFFLADYRFDDNSLDYVLDEWEPVDLSSLGALRSVQISFDSSDVGSFGINTPTYVALDHLDFQVIPEPHAAGLMALLLVGWWGTSRGRKRC